MSRHIKSPTRTISNRGPLPRFIGYFPCFKSDAEWIPFDSLSSLAVGIYLEWLQSVKKMGFETERYAYQIDDQMVTVIPDYQIWWDADEYGHVEAKYDRYSLPDEEKLRLSQHAQFFESQGRSYEVYYHTELQQDGFIQTLKFLRRYACLSFADSVIERTVAKLKPHEPKTLKEYSRLAAESGISRGLLYHLLYHQRLDLHYQAFSYEDLELCRV